MGESASLPIVHNLLVKETRITITWRFRDPRESQGVAPKQDMASTVCVKHQECSLTELLIPTAFPQRSTQLVATHLFQWTKKPIYC